MFQSSGGDVSAMLPHLWVAAFCIPLCAVYGSDDDSYLSTTKQEKLPLHPKSPQEADPTSLRLKRQVYLSGASENADDDPQHWGNWMPSGECSRTCGGGVLLEKRKCLQQQCTGPQTRYVSCNIEDCPEGSTDFRAEQCAKFNDSPVDGKYYKWVPYEGKNLCELTCKPETSDFYYKWADKVVDGTKCDKYRDNICVEGICLHVGCDKKIGSSVKLDKCGVCGGNGSSCRTVEGIFDEQNLSPGYHDIVRIPAGAMSISVRELRATFNSLAIKNASNNFYLNGNHQIQVVNKPLEIANTIFNYESIRLGGRSFEQLSAKGPTSEDLIIALLFQQGSLDSVIQYEYSVGLKGDIPYIYKPTEWSECSVTCGKGVQTRKPICVKANTKQQVDEKFCEEQNITQPESERACETVNCEAEWFIGEWEPCSATCGKTGQAYRTVYCHQVFADGKQLTVNDSNCTSERPSVQQECNRFDCPEWETGPWSACSKNCGKAFQYRSVTCKSGKDGEKGKLLGADACGEEKPASQRSCFLGPCEGLEFHMSEWNLCKKCNDTEESRNVTCEDSAGHQYPLEKCLIGSNASIPVDKRKCEKEIPCIYEWHVSQWSQCDTECGHGHQTRKVVCAIFELNGITIVDNSLCNRNEQPDDTKECESNKTCTGTFFATEWSKCSEPCGGGKQTRTVVCLDYDNHFKPEMCNEADKPATEQECNVEPCKSCNETEFGCCPDGVTTALDAENGGCPNITECMVKVGNETVKATGKQCEEMEVEGSGEDAEVEEKKESDKEESEAENEAEILKTNATVASDEVFDNETDSNATVSCTKTKYGCCPDWVNAAEGPNNEGCVEFVLGACNETTYGCCEDNVTLARGPNFEGCGDASCAASLYGCCKDRVTVAFGPHYKGCDRSAFPCETSEFGCCPDGETAALGENGKGCASDCLVSRHGCCPDGVTPATGPNNEGCGCAYAKHGCCPDGKTPAKGLFSFGCPQSCAVTKFGCCPDGKTTVLGENNEGCPCQYTKYGCCPDGETAAIGPMGGGCNDCRRTKYGCCSDGVSRALGPNYAGCPTTTVPTLVVDGAISPEKIMACSRAQDPGKPCQPSFELMWFYDMSVGQCSQFWYGGCEGNENRFSSKEQCEQTCVEPPGKGRCYLPKSEGPMSCNALSARYYYDHETRQCHAFWWRGCHGNANNFESWERCIEYCINLDAKTPSYNPMLQSPEMPEVGEPQQQEQEVIQNYVPEPEIVDNNHYFDICRLNKDAGSCNNYVPVFYYDVNDGYCKYFYYGGCGGNANRFNTREECEERCGQQSYVNPQPMGYERPNLEQPVPVVMQAPTQPLPVINNEIVVNGKTRDACNERMDYGTCLGSFKSYYYDKKSGQCLPFVYTGCGGTRNRFHTKRECEELCLRTPGVLNNSETYSTHNYAPHQPIQNIPVPQGASDMPQISPCELPKDSGRCNKFETKWYYNKTDGTCSRFHYGGCEGNTNRFDTEHQCKKACSNYTDPCTLPKIPGPCSGKHERYYYNQRTRSCEIFQYGGCLGNSNNFRLLSECRNRCEIPNMQQMESLRIADGSKPWLCMLPKEVGRCRASFIQYYYDKESNQCVEFIYGGCEGNQNRFNTREECQEVCLPEPKASDESSTKPSDSQQQVDDSSSNVVDSEENIDKYTTVSADETLFEDDNVKQIDAFDESAYRTREPSVAPIERVVVGTSSSDSPLPELCLLAEERGTCYGDVLRWRYDSEKSVCVSFSYTGCNHNANFFTSIEACERACGMHRNQDVCSLPVSPGPCENGITRWHYNLEAKDCQAFMYSGCGGNGNRFSTKAECENLCAAEEKKREKDVCKMERDSGPCTDPVTQWYYDSSDSTCKQFTYGGCRGNKNRFDTKEQCLKRCASTTLDTLLLTPHVICTMSPDPGSCDEKVERWFFDILVGYCRTFYYSGCGGNQNRFSDEQKCMEFCSPLTAKPVPLVRPTVKVYDSNQVTAGMVISLHCVTNGQIPILWFKDGVDIFSDSTSKRIQLNDEKDHLTIQNAKETDSGLYTCSAGGPNLLSEPIDIVVKTPTVVKNCFDKASETTCGLVVRMNLCDIPRYGNQCCQSCAIARSHRVIKG
uniref:Papilin n=1 Tax=Syphacia muris TaxID=451379 RepID=A0A158R5U1_9BILA